MTLKELVKHVDGETPIRLSYNGNLIVRFNAKFWDCLDPSILNLEISKVEIAFDPERHALLLVETEYDRPIYVHTQEEMQLAFDNDAISCIALAADIVGTDESTYTLDVKYGVKNLDLNGFMIKANPDNTRSNSGAICVSNGATLNIYDTQGGGYVDGGHEAAKDNTCIEVREGSLLNIFAGTFTAGNESETSTVILTGGGATAIYGGYFFNSNYLPDDNIVLDATQDQYIAVYGGIYESQDPTAYLARCHHAFQSERNVMTFRVV